MIIKTGFGRLGRYECDSGDPCGCPARETVLVGEDPPEGWMGEDAQGRVYCPEHARESENHPEHV